MKIIIVLIFLSLCSMVSLSQRVYYVQDKAYNTNASDMNPGTDKNYPWATLQKAFTTAEAGDTVFMRGGTWQPTSRVQHIPGSGYGNNGTYSNWIVWINYPGESPVLDCVNYTDVTANDEGFVFMGSTYVELNGLEVKNCDDRVLEQYIVGVDVTNCGTVTIKNVKSHHHGGYGFQVNGYDTVYFINCDAYWNLSDNSAEPGDKADGFGGGSGGTSADTFKIAYYEGCRAWHNSDDGFDFGSSKQLQISNCWSFDNGHLAFGEGVAFKFPPSEVLDTSKNVIHHCIAANNKLGGFVVQNLNDLLYGANIALCNNTVYNCESAFANSPGDFQFGDGKMFTSYVNNLVYTVRTYCGPGNYIDDGWVSHNSWITTVSWPYWDWSPTSGTITDADFVSVDPAQLYYTRKADGSLPDITFMKLAEGSKLIDAGTDVGLSFNASAPDIGAFELDTIPGTENSYPFVEISSPLNGRTLTNNNISLIANAFDVDGSVTKVEFFYDNIIKIGEVNNSPWSFTWTNAPLGSHYLKAVVTDDSGAKSTSSRIKVAIIPDLEESNNLILFPNPNNGLFTLFLTSPLELPLDIKICSLEGKVIFNDTLAADESIKQLDLAFLKSGIYLAILTSFNCIFTLKFIKI
jgi:hypothetical protein